jgi:hypothetical protein
MNKDVRDKLYELALKDYDVYMAKVEEVERENPDLSFEELDALVEHGSMEVPEDLQGYDEEYEDACLMVYLLKTLEAYLEDED